MASGDTIVLAEGKIKLLLDFNGENTRFFCGEKIAIQLIESMDFTGAAKFTLDFVENEVLSFCRLRTV